MMNKSIVIGGGSGFIGQHLSNNLKKLGYTPILISRKNDNKLANVLTWEDIRKQGLPNCCGVIGLQGQNIMDFTQRWTESFQNLVWDSRINTTKLLREAIIAKNKMASGNSKDLVKFFLSSSAISYYEPDPVKVYDETYKSNFKVHKDMNTNSYPKGQEVLALTNLCHEWEKAAIGNGGGNKNIAEDSKHATIIIRIGLVLGRDGGLIKNMLPAFKMYLGNKALGSGEQWFPWIHVDDIVGIFVKCITRYAGEGGVDQTNQSTPLIFNGVSPEPCKNHVFHSAMASALNRPTLLPAVPESVLTLLIGPVRAQLLTHGQHVIPKATLETLGYQFKYQDIRMACDQVCGLF